MSYMCSSLVDLVQPIQMMVNGWEADTVWVATRAGIIPIVVIMASMICSFSISADAENEKMEHENPKGKNFVSCETPVRSLHKDVSNNHLCRNSKM